MRDFHKKAPPGGFTPTAAAAGAIGAVGAMWQQRQDALEHEKLLETVAQEAALRLPRKQAMRDLTTRMIATRDTALKLCLEDVLASGPLSNENLALKLEGRTLQELLAPVREDGSLWVIDHEPLLWVGQLTFDESDPFEVRASLPIQLLRNLPDEVAAGLPAGVRPWTPELEARAREHVATALTAMHAP